VPFRRKKTVKDAEYLTTKDKMKLYEQLRRDGICAENDIRRKKSESIITDRHQA
jgi:hypothetical protein